MLAGQNSDGTGPASATTTAGITIGSSPDLPYSISAASQSAGSAIAMSFTEGNENGAQATYTATATLATSAMTVSSAAAGTDDFFVATTSWLAAGFKVGDSVTVGHGSGTDCASPGTFTVASITTNAPYQLKVTTDIPNVEDTSGHCTVVYSRTGSSPVSPVTIAGLGNGITYGVTVVGTNEFGSSAATASVNAVPVTRPDAPTEAFGVSGNSQVDVAWTAPTDSGGGTLRYYTVWVDPPPIQPDAAIGTAAVVIASTTAGSSTITGGTSFAVAGYGAGDTVVVSHASGTTNCASTGTYTVTSVAGTAMVVSPSFTGSEASSGHCVISRTTTRQPCGT